MIDRIRNLIIRSIGVLVGGILAWLTSRGLDFGAQFGPALETTLTLGAMGVFTIITNWLVRALGPVASFIVGIEREE